MDFTKLIKLHVDLTNKVYFCQVAVTIYYFNKLLRRVYHSHNLKLFITNLARRINVLNITSDPVLAMRLYLQYDIAKKSCATKLTNVKASNQKHDENSSAETFLDTLYTPYKFEIRKKYKGSY